VNNRETIRRFIAHMDTQHVMTCPDCGAIEMVTNSTLLHWPDPKCRVCWGTGKDVYLEAAPTATGGRPDADYDQS
jgi:hypothetical protein